MSCHCHCPSLSLLYSLYICNLLNLIKLRGKRRVFFTPLVSSWYQSRFVHRPLSAVAPAAGRRHLRPVFTGETRVRIASKSATYPWKLCLQRSLHALPRAAFLTHVFRRVKSTRRRAVAGMPPRRRQSARQLLISLFQPSVSGFVAWNVSLHSSLLFTPLGFHFVGQNGCLWTCFLLLRDSDHHYC